MASEKKTIKPYKAKQLPNSSFWVLTDTRNNQPVSYPTIKFSAQAEARFMNDQYAKEKAGAR